MKEAESKVLPRATPAGGFSEWVSSNKHMYMCIYIYRCAYIGFIIYDVSEQSTTYFMRAVPGNGGKK